MGAVDRWWLEGADEQCVHCDVTYAYEAEVRCAECDGAMCPLCATWSERRARCPDCTGPGRR